MSLVCADTATYPSKNKTKTWDGEVRDTYIPAVRFFKQYEAPELPLTISKVYEAQDCRRQEARTRSEQRAK